MPAGSRSGSIILHGPSSTAPTPALQVASLPRDAYLRDILRNALLEGRQGTVKHASYMHPPTVVAKCVRLTDLLALQVVVLDAATTRVAAGTASECQTFQLDMPRQVRSMMSSLSVRMNPYHYHAGLPLIPFTQKDCQQSSGCPPIAGISGALGHRRRRPEQARGQDALTFCCSDVRRALSSTCKGARAWAACPVVKNAVFSFSLNDRVMEKPLRKVCLLVQEWGTLMQVCLGFPARRLQPWMRSRGCCWRYRTRSLQLQTLPAARQRSAKSALL